MLVFAFHVLTANFSILLLLAMLLFLCITVLYHYAFEHFYGFYALQNKFVLLFTCNKVLFALEYA